MDSIGTNPRLDSGSRAILKIHNKIIAIFADLFQLELKQQTRLASRNQAEVYLYSEKDGFSCTRRILLNNKDTLSTVIIRLDHQIVPPVNFALFKDFQNLVRLWVMQDPSYGDEEKPELKNLLNLPRTLRSLGMSNININVKDMEQFCKKSGRGRRLLERLTLRDCGVFDCSDLRTILQLRNLTFLSIKSIDISTNRLWKEFVKIAEKVGLESKYQRWLHKEQEIEINWKRENANNRSWQKQILWRKNYSIFK